MRAAILLAAASFLSVAAPIQADTWTFNDDDGKEVTLEARLVGSGQGAHVLELDDGQYRLVPQENVKKRVPGDDPTPATADKIIERLTDKFGADVLKTHVEKPFVVGLVLTAPMQKQHDVRVRGFLKKAGKFMRIVESVFEDFTKTARLQTMPPKFPLVVLIFETDTDFEKFATETTGGRGLSAGNIAGFYSGMTNWLAIRLGECNTFEVPLHEAIHQQTFNRGVLNRLAPNPKWFSEGIATGFEGNGEKIDIGPFKINSNYGRRAMTGTVFSWEEVVANDRSFGADVLAGDAYTHAWSLHWMLCTKFKDQYTKYVQSLGKRQALETVSADDRVKEFESAFGKDVSKMQKDFKQALELGVKRQKVTLEKPSTPGVSHTNSNLAEVEFNVIKNLDADGAIGMKGVLRNASPLRAMSYLITVETDAGVYADWHVPNLEIKKTVTLNQQWATKVMKGAPGGYARTFRVRIRSAVPDSREAEQWKAGNIPVPEYSSSRDD